MNRRPLASSVLLLVVGSLGVFGTLGCGGSTAATDTAGASAGAESAAGASGVRLLPAMRPCEVTMVTSQGASNECIELERVQPEGRPYPACNGHEGLARFRYDTGGRVVESPSGTWRYEGATAAVRQGDVISSYEFDDAHRMVRSGLETYGYDRDGRLIEVRSGDRTVRYTYAADDTYSVTHDYPDTDEFCVGERVEVQHDADGRAILDRYEGCQINEPLRTLRYTYEGDRITRVEVDTGSDGTVDRVLTLGYACDAPG